MKAHIPDFNSHPWYNAFENSIPSRLVTLIFCQFNWFAIARFVCHYRINGMNFQRHMPYQYFRTIDDIDDDDGILRAKNCWPRSTSRLWWWNRIFPSTQFTGHCKNQSEFVHRCIKVQCIKVWINMIISKHLFPIYFDAVIRANQSLNVFIFSKSPTSTRNFECTLSRMHRRQITRFARMHRIACVPNVCVWTEHLWNPTLAPAEGSMPVRWSHAPFGWVWSLIHRGGSHSLGEYGEYGLGWVLFGHVQFC